MSFYSLIKSLFWLRDSLKFIQVINIWSSTLSSLEPWGISKSGRNHTICTCSFILKCDRCYDGKGRENVLWAFVISTVQVHMLVFKVRSEKRLLIQKGKRSLEAETHDGHPLFLLFPSKCTYNLKSDVLLLSKVCQPIYHHSFRFTFSLMLMYGIFRIWFLS